MTSIIVQGVATDPDLPTDTDLKTYLAAHAATQAGAWIQTDAEHCTITGGKIVSALSVTGDGSKWVGDQGGPTVAVDSTFGGYTAATTLGTAADRLQGPLPTALSGSFSVLMLVKRSADITAAGIMFVWPGTNGASISINHAANGEFQFWRYWGSGSGQGAGISIAAPASAPDSVPRLVIATFNGSQISGQCNNGVIASASVGTTTAPNTSQTTIGQSSKMVWSDCVILSGDILDASNAELLADWKDYFSGTYSIDLG